MWLLAGAVVTLLVPASRRPLLGRATTGADTSAHGPLDHEPHRHGGEHEHEDEDHVHVGGPRDTARTIELQQKVLAKNDELADANRQWLRDRGILAVNLMSSPGSGKTTLLERTTRDLAGKMSISVIEGDQETALDAKRIQAAGSRVVQINTGVGCHLDAEMVAAGLRSLDPPSGSIVVIENVGNLVCPALFDLGEAAKVVLASVTEGADKPLKYPHMFRQADLVLLNKTDLLPYVDFDLKQYMSDLRRAVARRAAAPAVGDHRRRHAGLVRLAAPPHPAAARVARDRPGMGAICWAYGPSNAHPCATGSPRTSTSRASGRGPRARLAEADAAVVARHPAVHKHAEARVRPGCARPGSVSSRFWNTPPDSATTARPLCSRSRAQTVTIAAATPLWNRAAMTGDRARQPAEVAARRRAARRPRRTASAAQPPQPGAACLDVSSPGSCRAPCTSASCSSSMAAWPS